MANSERRKSVPFSTSSLLNPKSDEETSDQDFGDNESDEEFQPSAKEEKEDDDDENSYDSDVSKDEFDMREWDDEEEEGKNKRAKAKIYKEPAPVKPKPNFQPTASTSGLKTVQAKPSKGYGGTSVRKSTAAKSAATYEKLKIRHLEQQNKIKKPKKEKKKLTQEELLDEAKLTELENAKSLAKLLDYNRDPSIKKGRKKTYTEPTIVYWSTKVPLNGGIPSSRIKELEEKKEAQASTPTFINKDPNTKPKKLVDNRKMEEMTFISINSDPDHKVSNKVFPNSTAKPYPKQLKCAVTGEPAKYVDPVTCMPYHSIECFKVIRKAYYEQLKKNANKDKAVNN